MTGVQPLPGKCFRSVSESLDAPGPNYFCSNCGAHGLKLWREYQTFADVTNLFCASCACKIAKMVDDVDADGRVSEPILGGRRTDAIGWRVPAVPTKEGDTFWGYTSVPDDDVAWWRRLPTRRGGEAICG